MVDGEDWCSLAVLERYQTARQRHNLLMMGMMDLLCRGFGNDKRPLLGLRNLAFWGLQKTPPLKQEAMRWAMGLRGALPELARVAV